MLVCESSGMKRYANDVERVIPLSGIVCVGSAGVAIGGDGVGGVEVDGDSVRDRVLNANFCFGVLFVFSAAMASESCFSCYCEPRG